MLRRSAVAEFVPTCVPTLDVLWVTHALGRVHSIDPGVWTPPRARVTFVIECGPRKDVGWNDFLGRLDGQVSEDKHVGSQTVEQLS